MKFLLVVLVIAVAVYLLVRLIQRRGLPRPPEQGHPGSDYRRPMGPDDDPDFIWNLNKKRRHPKGEDQ